MSFILSTMMRVQHLVDAISLIDLVAILQDWIGDLNLLEASRA